MSLCLMWRSCARRSPPRVPAASRAAQPAAARRLDSQPVALGELSVGLRRQLVAVEQVAAALPVAAATATPRGVAAALADQGETHRFQRLDLPRHPAPTRLRPVPAASAADREL